jgi:hypothetical protein
LQAANYFCLIESPATHPAYLASVLAFLFGLHGSQQSLTILHATPTLHSDVAEFSDIGSTLLQETNAAGT